MGFMDISISGSDAAADFDWSLGKCKTSEEAFAQLKQECRSDHGPYNTPGWLNVALVLTEGVGRFLQTEGLQDLISEVIECGESEIPLWPEEHHFRLNEIIEKLKNSKYYS